MRVTLALCFSLVAVPAFPQQVPDAAKLAPFYRQQRDMATDSLAACSAIASDLQAKIAELEKKLAEARKE